MSKCIAADADGCFAADVHAAVGPERRVVRRAGSLHLRQQDHHVDVVVMSMWSPVLKAMFGGAFRESAAAVVELPGKHYDDLLELICVLHPPNKPIDGMLFSNCQNISLGRGRRTRENFGIMTLALTSHLPHSSFFCRN